ncbi:MAG: HPr(Ser) kinase/phosphatase [Culicoidibacterales bacterium]
MNVTVKDIVEQFKLTVLTGGERLEKVVLDESLSRPALELAGYFEFYPSERIQVFGLKEMTFLAALDSDTKKQRLQKLFADPQTPCFIVTRGLTIDEMFLTIAEEMQATVLQAQQPTTFFMGNLVNYLNDFFAPRTDLHGVMLDIKGVGVLIVGESSVGKSEAALELVTRGHQLVSDDRIIAIEKEPGLVTGQAPKLLENMIEIRGVGVVNVLSMYGAGAVRKRKRLQLIVELVDWTKGLEYDRIGLSEHKETILNTEVQKNMLPVRPGRSVALLIESAALNHRLREVGINSAQEFIDRLTNQIKGNE